MENYYREIVISREQFTHDVQPHNYYVVKKDSIKDIPNFVVAEKNNKGKVVIILSEEIPEAYRPYFASSIYLHKTEGNLKCVVTTKHIETCILAKVEANGHCIQDFAKERLKLLKKLIVIHHLQPTRTRWSQQELRVHQEGVALYSNIASGHRVPFHGCN